MTLPTMNRRWNAVTRHGIKYVTLPTMNRRWNAVTRHGINYINLPTMNRSWNAVSQTSGMAAASINFMLDGRGISNSSLLATYSALPPPKQYKNPKIIHLTFS